LQECGRASTKEPIKEILMACAEENEMVLGKPEPLVFFMGFGESALDFELKVWTDEFDNRFTVISDLNQEIEKRFRDRGIEIPFPQRDLHIRSADEKIMEGLSPNGKISQSRERS
jgi:potassium-dependent mechanosensitive channel